MFIIFKRYEVFIVGVTIATLTGDNGLLTKAGKAKQLSEESTVKEKVRLILIKYKMENNKELLDFLEDERAKNEIDDYTLNNDNTLTINIDNYYVVINQLDFNITNIGKIENKNKIIGEVYTTDTSGNNASIKVISYSDNTEKEIKFSTVKSTPQEFCDFNVSYPR